MHILNLNISNKQIVFKYSLVYFFIYFLIYCMKIESKNVTTIFNAAEYFLVRKTVKTVKKIDDDGKEIFDAYWQRRRILL